MNYAEYRLQDVLQEEDSAIEKIVISPKNRNRATRLQRQLH